MQACRPCPMCHRSNVYKKYIVDDFLIVTCDYCGLVFTDNPTAPEREEQNYHEYYAASAYQEYEKNSSDAELGQTWCINEQRIHLIQKTQASGKLLDIGCGRGFFLAHAQQAGFDCQGIEISGTAAQYASEHFKLPIHVCNIETTGFEGEFDVITMWHILEHFYDPLAVLKNVNAMLKPGGKLFVEVPNLYSLKFLLQPGSKRWQGGNHPKYHRSFFTWETLTQMLEKAELTNFTPIPFVYCKSGIAKLSRRLLMRMHAGPFITCYLEKPDRSQTEKMCDI